MKKIEEHDIILMNDRRVGCVIHVYNSENFVVEIIDNEGKSCVETISIDSITEILEKL